MITEVGRRKMFSEYLNVSDAQWWKYVLTKLSCVLPSFFGISDTPVRTIGRHLFILSSVGRHT